MKKNKFRFPVKLISVILIIFLAMFFIIGYIYKTLSYSDYFKIKDIINRDNGVVDLSYLKGRNIFSVDIGKEARYALGFYPDYSKVRLVRVFPDRLFVDLVKRKAVACVKLYKYFVLDENGILFSMSNDLEGQDIPLIVGLETKIFGPKPGQAYRAKEVMAALEIIREIKKNKALRGCPLKKIDVAGIGNTAIFLAVTVPPADFTGTRGTDKGNWLEVKIGQDNIKGKIAILGEVVAASKRDLANIKYIDLRFKEPVIKLSDVKLK
jgi:hypothetical protein